MKKQKIEFILKKGEFVKLSLKLWQREEMKMISADCKQIWDTLDMYTDNKASKKNSRKMQKKNH